MLIGAGFIGMEVAASLTQRGVQVTIIEALPHIWARFADPTLAASFESYCTQRGITFQTNEMVTEIRGRDRTAGGLGYRLPPLSADSGNPPPDRCRRPPQDEAHSHPGGHRARRGGGYRGRGPRLRERWIAGAALDVLETEPMPTSHPLVGLDNVILTPPAAWYSEDSIVECKRKPALAVRRVLEGQVPAAVANPEVLQPTAVGGGPVTRFPAGFHPARNDRRR